MQKCQLMSHLDEEIKCTLPFRLFNGNKAVFSFANFYLENRGKNDSKDCPWAMARNTKGGSITVPSTSCLTGFDWSVSQIRTKIVSCHTTNFKPVKQKDNGTVILPPVMVTLEGIFLKLEGSQMRVCFFYSFSGC
jgi:hypothetical protein